MQDIKQTVIELMDAAAARGLAEFELEVDDFKLKLKMGGSAAAVPASVPVVAAVPVAAAPAAVSAAPAAASTVSAPAPAAQGVPEGRTVEAPLVGIFYAAPAPEVGQTVKKGDTLFIIEAMKTMNEIAAPCDGRISHILAQSGDMVEYGQVVVVMEEES